MSYRYCLSRLGEIDTDDTPPSLYYSDAVLGPMLKEIFLFREQLPFGKVPLQSDKLAYSSGVFYIKKGGNWENFSKLIVKYKGHKSTNQHESATPIKR